MGNVCLQPCQFEDPDQPIDSHADDDEPADQVDQVMVENMQSPGELTYIRQTLGLALGSLGGTATDPSNPLQPGYHRHQRPLFTDDHGRHVFAEDLADDDAELQTFALHPAPIRPMSTSPTLFSPTDGAGSLHGSRPPSSASTTHSSRTLSAASSGLFFGTLMSAVPATVGILPTDEDDTKPHSNQHLRPTPSPTPRAPSISIQRSLFLATGEKGPLILPRSSSLTTLVLDMRPVVDLLFRHLSYREVQKFSRVSRLWREAAAPVLARHAVVVTLGWDWGGREWSIQAFPWLEYEIVNGPRIKPAPRLDLELQEEVEGAGVVDADGFEEVFIGGEAPVRGKKRGALAVKQREAKKNVTRVTVYRPVTFNMEDVSPGPFPARSAEISQIRITPLAAATPRVFNVQSEGPLPGVTASKPGVATTPTLGRNEFRVGANVFVREIDPTMEEVEMEDVEMEEPVRKAASGPPAERCVRGRLPRRDYAAFMDAVYGTSFGLVLSPSGANFETLAVVTKEWRRAEGVEDEEERMEPAPLLTLADEEPKPRRSSTDELVARIDDLLAAGAVEERKKKEEEGKVKKEGEEEAPEVLCSGYRLEELRGFAREVGFPMNLLEAVVNTVAMKRYLSASEEERIWAFRHVVETLLEPSDPERGHHELNDSINRLDKIAHRVEILTQVGIPGNQRVDRLRSYYAEGCRAWRSIVGGDLALRVAGYRGNLGNDDAVYRYLSGTLLPSFT
ncbi:hypothetical protein HDU96_004590 [Phlyctochytrium bullatum]|nr:hypothetical protein HDU96_004590 [Phlyctochytrium bullatum]